MQIKKENISNKKRGDRGVSKKNFEKLLNYIEKTKDEVKAK